jgi:hypothetical protein
MPWVRFDDQYPIHRKVKPLSDSEMRFHIEAIFWCARNLTDGFVPAEDASDVSAVRRPHKVIPCLVARGLLHEAGHVCQSPKCPPSPGGDGWMIHDYLDYQPSKLKVRAEREAKRVRQDRWLAKKAGRPVDNRASTGVQLSTDDLPEHVPRSPKLDAKPDASQDASVDAPPPRPAPKEGGRGPAAPPAAALRRGRDAGGEQVNGHITPVCPNCGNRTDSPYHRNACRSERLARTETP